MLLDVLEQGAARAMHDALRHPGRAGRIRARTADGRTATARMPASRRLASRDPLVPRHGGRPRWPDRRQADRGHDHQLPYGRQPADHLDELRPAVERLPAVVVPVHRNQNGGFDLAESIDDAIGAEIRRTGRPHRANRGTGQRRDDRFGHVGHDARHAVARPDARPHEGVTRASHLLPQVTELSVSVRVRPHGRR